jgi:hypothetical protein
MRHTLESISDRQWKPRHLQHVATAAALNLVRLTEWLAPQAAPVRNVQATFRSLALSGVLGERRVALAELGASVGASILIRLRLVGALLRRPGCGGGRGYRAVDLVIGGRETDRRHDARRDPRPRR